MLTLIDLRGRTTTTSELRRALPRGGTDVASVAHIVTPVVEAVRERGAEAAWNTASSLTRSVRRTCGSRRALSTKPWPT